MTPAQRHALEALWPYYGVELPAGPLDFERVFGRRAPVMLEIGFGNGESLAHMASEHPENDYLGIEVHRPGVGHLLLQLEQRALRNVRVLCADASLILQHHVPDATLDAVFLFFPDPWPKKRHHKRRLIQPEFVALLSRRLKPGGLLHIATDWTDYADHILQTVGQNRDLMNTAGEGRVAERPAYRLLTKFERRGRRLGHEVRDLLFRRVG